jgi:enoyl-CoA hydratase/carnithine racemase
MPYQDLIVEREESVRVITLNRPNRRNALSLGLMSELIACLDETGRDRSIRTVILAAAGAAFCSGHDLSETVGGDINQNRRLFDICTVLMEKLQSIPQPVIAEVQGIATAAGCQLVASCDLAIAAEEASFATPGVRIGLFCSTPMVALSRAVGRKRALEMLLTGEPIDAHTAADWGLVNRVVPVDELRAETLKLARRIAEASDRVVALGKQAYYGQIDLDQPKAYDYAQDVMTKNAGARDAQEGISAFLEKRTPCWTGE